MKTTALPTSPLSFLCLALLLTLPGCICYPRISNIVPNPEFEAGNTGFKSQYQYSLANDNAGDYFIGSQPNQYNSNWPNDMSPHGGRAMMIVDGAEAPDQIVWATPKLHVHPHTTYYFSLFVTSLFHSSPAILRISVNGLAVGPDFSPGATVGEWRKACFAWKSGDNTDATLSIVDKNTTYYGNDFALDGPSFGTIHKCKPPPTGCLEDQTVLPAAPES
jgi:hypothetical protein